MHCRRMRKWMDGFVALYVKQAPKLCDASPAAFHQCCVPEHVCPLASSPDVKIKKQKDNRPCTPRPMLQSAIVLWGTQPMKNSSLHLWDIRLQQHMKSFNSFFFSVPLKFLVCCANKRKSQEAIQMLQGWSAALISLAPLVPSSL